MKVLVTGAGGFLGTRVVERLLAHGYRDIRCVLRERGKAAKLDPIRMAYPDANVEIVFANLKSKADCVRVAEDVTMVFHLAAAMKGSAADMFMDSVVASRNLLEAIGTRKPMRIVLVSSFGVYGTATVHRGAVVNESTPLEPEPAKRDVYSHTKLRQEQMFRESQEKYGFELVILRPGVIYGPGGGHFSGRVGLSMFGVFLHLGGSNALPLSYVENCAEAIVVAGSHEDAAGQVYNVHDNELPSSRKYLSEYRKNVRKIRCIRVPYFALMLLSRGVEWYHGYSKGQLPAIFTRYKTKSMWGGNRFDNSKLKATGWEQLVPTSEGLRRTFESFRT